MGPMPSGRWQISHFSRKIGAISLANVTEADDGASTPCACAGITPTVTETANPITPKRAIPRQRHGCLIMCSSLVPGSRGTPHHWSPCTDRGIHVPVAPAAVEVVYLG